MRLRCGDFILKDGLRVQKACTNVTDPVKKNSAFSADCKSALGVLSSAPKSNNDDFDFTAGFLSTSSLRTRTRAPNDGPTSIEQIDALMSAFGGKADITI
jgi:hypothetical protein